MTNTSNSNLQLFSYESKEIRTTTINGEPWWVAKDVCDILGLSEVSKSVERLDDDEKLIRTFFVSGQNRDMMTVNESGLYALIIRSNKPEAKAFRKWVTSVVLPQIRKTGSYVSEASKDEQLSSRVDRLEQSVIGIAKAVESMAQAITALTDRFTLIEATPKKPALLAKAEKSTDKSGKDLLTPDETASMLNISIKTLNNWRHLGKGPYWVCLGRMVRYEKQSVLEYLEQCHQKTWKDRVGRSNDLYILENAMMNKGGELVDVSEWRIRKRTLPRVQALKDFLEHDEKGLLCEDDVINKGLELLYESILTKE